MGECGIDQPKMATVSTVWTATPSLGMRTQSPSLYSLPTWHLVAWHEFQK